MESDRRHCWVGVDLRRPFERMYRWNRFMRRLLFCRF
jgi:hypothetical protein